MTERYYFETTKSRRRNDHAGHVRALVAKRRAQHEARQLREAETKRRAATQLELMISNLEREVAQLESSISSELELADVRDPSHFGFPISVRTMTNRRDNLRVTIVVLSDRLAMTDEASRN
jgi:hypothetical protein